MANEKTFDEKERRPSGKGGGQWIDHITRHMLDTRLQADTIGDSKDGIELKKMGLLTGMDTPAVQAYATQAINLVRKYSASAADLKNLIPLLNEIQRNAEEDPTLRKLEKEHIAKIVASLRQFVGKKTRLTARLGANLKNIAKAKTQQWREALGDKLQSNDSVLFRLAGRALRPKEDRGPARSQEETAEAVARNAAMWGQRQKKGIGYIGPGGRSASVWDEDDEDEVYGSGFGEEGKSRKKKKRRGDAVDDGDYDYTPQPVSTGRAAKGKSSNSPVAFKKLIDISAQTRDEVKGVKAALLGQTKQDIKLAEDKDKQSERDADAVPGLFGKLVNVMKGKEAVPKTTGPFGGIFTTLLRLFAGPGRILAAMTPILTVLAQGAAVVGAAFIGWEVGKMIDKWTGASNAVQWIAEELGKKFGFGGFGEVQAQEADMKARTIATAKSLSGRDLPYEEAKAVVDNEVKRLQSGASSTGDLNPVGSHAVGTAVNVQPNTGPTNADRARLRGARPNPHGSMPTPQQQGVTPSSTPPMRVNRQALLDRIAWAESKGSYNATIGDGLWRAGRHMDQKDPITKMTMKQIFDLQKDMVRVGAPSGAVGKYQFIQSTLFGENGTAENPAPNSLAGKAHLLATDEFTPEIQDRLASIQLDDFGLRKYEQGNRTDAETTKMLEGLSRSWAAVEKPGSGGQSFYKGQRATVMAADLAPMLNPSVSPTMIAQLTNPARSGVAVNEATMAAGGGNASGTPTVIVNAPVSNMAQAAPSPVVIPIPIRPDPDDPTIRRIAQINWF